MKTPSHSTEGYRLRYEKACVSLVAKAYRCPVTKRLLDTTLKGVSPYQTERTIRVFDRTQQIDMPQLPFPFRRQQGQKVSPEQITRWLNEEERVCNARNHGVWSEFSDRIAEKTHFFAVAEHSGQMSRERLQALESQFREGSLNLLSCSTTMEMGIDIGGLTSIAMNNAPPGPANWLQRAGRAGRREISRSSTLTLCQSQPHGQAVFQNPLWPFETAVHVPQVSLNSPRIVQRHVQAFLLGTFLQHFENALRLQCAWFFLDEASDSPSTQFLVWLASQAEQEDTIQQGCQGIVARSVAEGIPLTRMLEDASDTIRAIREQWILERQALLEELELAGGAPQGRQASPEQRAVTSQLRRHDEEYLLSELASQGFLPAQGFPLQVLPFVNTTAEQLAAEEKSPEDNDDALFHRRSYPSRQLPMAIREYAPGNQVMLDGVVFTSGGLTLHWHRPPNDEEFRETQAIRWVARCHDCGAVRTSGNSPQQCSVCGSERLQRRRYIQPSGFAVDIREQPDTQDVTTTYIPPRAPWIHCQGDWISLPNPAAGAFRYDPHGSVFSYSDGANGHGYAVCLRCGRAGSEIGQAEGAAPIPFHNADGYHLRLRSGRKDQDTHKCPGGDGNYAIQRNLNLAGEEQTDVFQLRLLHPNPEKRVPPENVATSLAVALRWALARELGIEQRELGWSVSSASQDGREVRDIFLYDVAAGGAGFVAAASQCLERLLAAARKLLEDCDCDSACHSCLLDFDTQHHAEQLDRLAALEWMDNAWMLCLQVPTEFQCFGSQTQFEARPLLRALLAEFEDRGLQRVRIYLHGSEGWDLEGWNLYRYLNALAMANVPVEILLPQTLRQQLPWHALHALAVRAAAHGLHLAWVAESEAQVEKGWLAAELQTNTQVRRWAVFNASALLPDSTWGIDSEGQPVVRGEFSEWKLVSSDPFTLSHVEATRAHASHVFQAQGELDGPIKKLGTKFWQQLTRVAPWLQDELNSGPPESIEYSDRYLVSPLAAKALYETLSYLIPKAAASQRPLHLYSLPAAASERQSRIFDNWPDAHSQQQTLEHLFGTRFDVQVFLRDRRNLPHARLLRLQWPQGTVVEISLDQGMGFVQAPRSQLHRFTDPPAQQARVLDGLDFLIHQQGDVILFHVMRRA